MKILICDDEQTYLNTLRIHIEEYMKNHHIPCAITAVVDPLQIAQNDTVFDLAFLDIQMEGMDGAFYKMAGIIPGKVWRTKKLTRFGYITLTQNTHMTENIPVLGKTELGVSPAHEFHYFDSENCGNSFHASKPGSKRGWDCIHGSDRLLAGFPHLYYYANPRIPQAFLEKCLEYKETVRE